MPVKHLLSPDKCEMAFWCAAAAATGGDITCKLNRKYRITRDNLGPVYKIYSNILEPMGIPLEVLDDHSFRINAKGIKISQVDIIAGKGSEFTEIGLDTPIAFIPLMALAQGKSTYRDLRTGIARLRFAQQLSLMGVNVVFDTEQDLLIVNGQGHLVPASMKAEEIRGASALMIAALSAQGTSEIQGMEQIFRGHEDILAKLHRLGAKLVFEGKNNTANKEKASPSKENLTDIMRRVKVVAIDWDDTIIKFAAFNRKAAKQLIARIISGGNPTPADYAYAEQKIGNSSERIRVDPLVAEVAQGAARRGVFDIKQLDGMRIHAEDEAFDEFLASEGRGGVLMPGTENLLIALREAGVEAYVVSKGRLENKIRQAEQLGIKHLFSGFYVSPDSDKESSMMRIAQEKGIEISEVAMIGDSVSVDVHPAKRVGATVIGFAENTARGNVLEQSGADAVIIGGFTELALAVKNITSLTSRPSTSGNPSFMPLSINDVRQAL